MFPRRSRCQEPVILLLQVVEQLDGVLQKIAERRLLLQPEVLEEVFPRRLLHKLQPLLRFVELIEIVQNPLDIGGVVVRFLQQVQQLLDLLLCDLVRSGRENVLLFVPDPLVENQLQTVVENPGFMEIPF